MRRLFIALPLIFGFALALSPMQAEVTFDEIVALMESNWDMDSHHHGDEGDAANHQHDHSDIDDCHATASHCAPSVSLIPIIISGRVSIVAAIAQQEFVEPLITGLQPLPLLPPPEYA